MSLAADALYDHEVLRGKLALLEELLPSLRVAPYTITRLTESIIACLHRHIDAADLGDAAAPSTSAPRWRDEHRELQTRASILLELIAPAGELAEQHALTHVGYFLADLRRHLREEEARDDDAQ